MIFTSRAPRTEAEEKFGDYYRTTKSSSFREKRAVANLDEEILFENLRENPVSEFDNIFSLYNQINDNNLHKAIVHFCSEFPDAVIQGRDHMRLLNDLKDETNTHATSDFNPWSLVALRELVSDAPEELEEELPIFLDLLKTRSSADSQHEKETWALLGIIYTLAAHNPSAVVRPRKDVENIFVDIATQSSIALNRALAVAILTRLADTLPTRGRRSITEHEEELSALLYDDSSAVQFHMCRLIERTGGFKHEKQQIKSLYSLSQTFGFGGVGENSPINYRLYLAAGRAHATVNGDRKTAQRARQFVDQGNNSEIFEADVEDGIKELQHPEQIIAEHASYMVVGNSRIPERLVGHFTEIARSISGTPHLNTKINLSTSIINICDASAGVLSDEIEFIPEDNQLDIVLNAVQHLWEKHPHTTHRGINLLTSVVRLKPDLVERRMNDSNFPDIGVIIQKSRIHPQVAGDVSRLLNTFAANDIQWDEIQKNTDSFPIIAKRLYDKDSGVHIYSDTFSRLAAKFIVNGSVSSETLQNLVSPISHLVTSEDSSEYARGYSIFVLALIAVQLDDRAIPPTIYDAIENRSELGLRLHVESTLAGILVISEEFEIPDHVRDWVTTYLDSSLDAEFHDYETIGEIASRIIGTIGDLKARQTLDELAEDSNYPIKTRQTAKKILEEYEREDTAE